MEETADSAGESASQLEGFSEQFRGAMSAAVTALAIGAAGLLSQVPVLGEAFAGLRAVVEAVAFQMDGVLRPAMSSVTETLFEIANSIFEAEGNVGDLIGKLGTLGATAGLVASALFALGVTLTGPVGIALAVITAAIAAFVVAWETNFANIRGITMDTFGRIQSRIQRFVSVVQPIIQSFIAFTSDLWQRYGEDIMSVIRFTFRVSLAIIESAIDTILTIIQVALQLLAGDWEGAFNSIVAFLRRSVARWGPIISDAAGGVMDVFTALAEDIVSWADDLASKAMNWGKNIIQNIIRGIQSEIDRLKSELTDLSNVAPGVDINAEALGNVGVSVNGDGGGGSSGRLRPFRGASSAGGGTQIDGRQLSESTGRYRADPGRRRGL